jgi:hypothetical protein
MKDPSLVLAAAAGALRSADFTQLTPHQFDSEFLVPNCRRGLGAGGRLRRLVADVAGGLGDNPPRQGGGARWESPPLVSCRRSRPKAISCNRWGARSDVEGVAVGQHIALRLSDNRVVAPSIAARRELARVVLHHGRAFDLLAFRGADDHPHMVALCSEGDAYEFARRVEITLSLRLRLDVRFERARVWEIRSQSHLTNAFHYGFAQEKVHRLDVDPCFDASNLPDLLGLRLLGRYTRETMRERLPRVQDEDLIAHFGITAFDEAPIDLAHLGDAAAAAMALPALVGRSKEVVLARCAAVHAARDATSAELALALGVEPRTVRHLRAAGKPPPALVDAVRLQLALRSTQNARRATRAAFAATVAVM